MRLKHLLSLALVMALLANVCPMSIAMAEDTAPSFSVEVVADAPAASEPAAPAAEPSAKDADETEPSGGSEGETAQEPGATGEGEAPAEDAAEEKEVDAYGVETNNGLRVEHRQPSEEIDENKGKPGAQPGDPAQTGLPEGYDIFHNPETGIYEVTYTIQEGTDAETLTLDLGAVREMLADYAAATSTTTLEPGDTRQFCIYINTDSLHTYKYVDGSFILTTPDFSDDADAIPEDPTVGFDGQELPEGAGYTYVGPNKTPIITSTQPMLELFKAAKLDCVSGCNTVYDMKPGMSAYDASKLSAYLNEKYGTSNLEKGIEAYLLERYSAADGTTYTSIDEVLANSELGYKELYPGEGPQYEMSVDGWQFTNVNAVTSLNGGKTVNSTSALQTALQNAINDGLNTEYNLPTSSTTYNNTAVVNGLVGSTSTTLAIRFDALQKMINEKLGTKYNFSGSTTAKTWTALKNALEKDKYTDIAAMVPTTTASATYVPQYLKIYDAASNYNVTSKQENAAYIAFMKKKGIDSKTVDIKGTTDYSASATAIATRGGLSGLKAQLIADEHDDIAALIPTSYSSSTYTKFYLQVYNAAHGSDTAAYEQYKKNLVAAGWDANKLQINEEVSAESGNSGKPIYVDPEKGFLSVDPATRYNNFYNNLLSFMYDKDELTGTLGGTTVLQTTTKREYTVTDMDDGKVYEHCVAAKDVSPTLVDELREKYYWVSNIPDDILVWIDPETKKVSWGFGTGNPDDKYATVSNSADCITATYTTTQVEYGEDSLHTDGIAASVGEFMKGADEEAWRTTNDMFNSLLAQGLTASDAARQAVSFYMAVNLDGKGTGNAYQDTAWKWDNTIQLERVDYQMNLEKVDEEGNTITDSETSFQLWYYNNGDVNDKYYVVEQEDADGNKTYGSVKYDESNKEMNYTITTGGGKLTVDYAMLKDIVYYLQEVVAPKGYELDTTVTIICDESAIDAIEDETEREAARQQLHEDLEALLDEDGNEHAAVDFHSDRISVKDGITIKVVNKKKDEPNNPPDPDNPPDNVPPEPITFEDYGVPLAGGINMNEGDCFN